jgi:hypothetical protein
MGVHHQMFQPTSTVEGRLYPGQDTSRFARRKPLAYLLPQPQALIGRNVFAYRNLNQDTWSLRATDQQEKNRIIGHQRAVLLENASFVVHETGRQQVLKTGQKNVHAGIKGTVAALGEEAIRRFDEANAVSVTYNPFRWASFVEAKEERPIHQARQVLINMDTDKSRWVLANKQPARLLFSRLGNNPFTHRADERASVLNTRHHAC